MIGWLILSLSVQACQWFEDPPYTATGLLNDEYWEINGGPFYRSTSVNDDTVNLQFGHLVNIKKNIPDYTLDFSGIPMAASEDTVRLSWAMTFDYGRIPSANQWFYDQEYGVTRAFYALDESKDNWIWFRLEANGDMVGSFEITLQKSTALNELPKVLEYRHVEFTATGPM